MDSTVSQSEDMPPKTAPAPLMPKLCLRLGNPYMLEAERDVTETNDNKRADLKGASHPTS
jgi:hypothetical protein